VFNYEKLKVRILVELCLNVSRTVEATGILKPYVDWIIPLQVTKLLPKKQ